MSRPAINATEESIFFEQVSAAKNRILLLDYDGTLAPFATNRHHAFPYPGITGLLRQIMTSCGTRLVLISGRSAHEVIPLLDISPPPEIWGTYGLERLRPNGHYEQAEIDYSVAEALVQSEDALERSGLAELVEVKIAGVAVHWRGLQPSASLEVRTMAFTILEPIAAQNGLILAEFEEGVEIRLAEANKGVAVRALLAEVGATDPIAYLGDDITDEDGFRVLNGRGLTVLVSPKPRFTAAQLWLRPPKDVIQFLGRWIKACGGES